MKERREDIEKNEGRVEIISGSGLEAKRRRKSGSIWRERDRKREDNTARADNKEEAERRSDPKYIKEGKRARKRSRGGGARHIIFRREQSALITYCWGKEADVKMEAYIG